MIVNAPVFQLNGVTYTYNYDGMNHLRRATRSQALKAVTYNMDYDLNGNVTRFVRDKRNPQKSIAQYYSYEGNRLWQMRRTATDTADGPGTCLFGYYSNGNMIGKRMENNRNPMDFQYNYLNLTDVVSTSQGSTIFTWLADGTRAQTRKVNGGQERGTVYLGSLMYDYTNTTLSVETLFDGGVIGAAQGGEYSTLYIADHLGSVRVAVSGQPMLFNEYEPFGLLEKEYSVRLFPQMPPELNDRLWSGKEELFPAGESILDFGARLYDPAIARWIAPDPMAEKDDRFSPYVYCFNNPLLYVDPDGNKPRIYIEPGLIGHTYVSAGDGAGMIVYSYGRYGQLHGISGITSGPINIWGEGVLFRYTGEDAYNYLYNSIVNNTARVFEIDGITDWEVQNYYDSYWYQSHTRPSDPDKKTYNDEDARVINEYNLFNNNCTTFSIDGINSGAGGTLISQYNGKNKVFWPMELLAMLKLMSLINSSHIKTYNATNLEDFLSHIEKLKESNN